MQQFTAPFRRRRVPSPDQSPTSTPCVKGAFGVLRIPLRSTLDPLRSGLRLAPTRGRGWCGPWHSREWPSEWQRDRTQRDIGTWSRTLGDRQDHQATPVRGASGQRSHRCRRCHSEQLSNHLASTCRL